MSGYGMRPATAGLPLFDQAQIRPVSRAADPGTSKAAEKGLRSSGALAAQCAETLAQLVAYIDQHGTEPTTRELAGGDEGKIHRLGRRLSDLLQTDPPRVAKSGERGKGTTWKPLPVMGSRVEIPKHLWRWERGDRFGVVVAMQASDPVTHKPMVRVRMEQSGDVTAFWTAEVRVVA